MQFRKTEQGMIFVLERGEWVMEQITKLLIKTNTNAAFIHGIGALENIELGFFDTRIKKYLRRNFNENYELLSFKGNVSILDRSPFCHAHVVLSNSDYEIIGGHFFEGRVAGTFEGEIQLLKAPLKRRFNEDIGLNLWDLSIEK